MDTFQVLISRQSDHLILFSSSLQIEPHARNICERNLSSSQDQVTIDLNFIQFNCLIKDGICFIAFTKENISKPISYSILNDIVHAIESKYNVENDEGWKYVLSNVENENGLYEEIGSTIQQIIQENMINLKTDSPLLRVNSTNIDSTSSTSTPKKTTTPPSPSITPEIKKPILSPAINNELFQQTPPVLDKVHQGVEMILSGKQILRYNMHEMSIWRSTICFTHSFLAESETWSLLGGLTVLCLITMLLVYFTDSAKSINDDYSVIGRVSMLMNFVLGGYVTICVNRWFTIRNQYLGGLWGSLENLNLYAFNIFNTKKSFQRDTDTGELVEDADSQMKREKECQWKNRITRYSRLIIQLVFQAARGEDQLEKLHEKQLLSMKEKDVLGKALLGTRPLAVVSWIWSVFDEARKEGYETAGLIFIQNNISALRGGIGGTLGVIGCPYPFYYVQLIHWSVQIYCFVLAVETGVNLTTSIYRLNNGDGQYTTDDTHWPANGKIWYLNLFLQVVVQNDLFALFAIGLIRFCTRISNPFCDDSTSFPPDAYDAFIFNNCRAMRVGMEEFDDLDDWEQLEQPISSKLIEKEVEQQTIVQNNFHSQSQSRNSHISKFLDNDDDDDDHHDEVEMQTTQNILHNQQTN